MAQSLAADRTWAQKGQDDAPVAMRAIARVMVQYGKDAPGYSCAVAIIEAYGRDMRRVGPRLASVERSEERLRLLTQLVSDANQSEWMDAFLSAPMDFMSTYRDAFVHELDSEVGSWASSPWKPGTSPDLVKEEEKWILGLAMGDLVLSRPQPKQGWRRFLGS
jgi:hypothetical protein